MSQDTVKVNLSSYYPFLLVCYFGQLLFSITNFFYFSGLYVVPYECKVIKGFGTRLRVTSVTVAMIRRHF